MKIPRDASRPKLEDLLGLADEMALLPFQPDEEEVLRRIIDTAQGFRDRIARYCNPLLSTEAEAETQRFFLRKLEGAEVLLAFETNFFRQELHKWCPVAPIPPPILEISLSTRKPRPTKLQKMLVEYGVEHPDDLPEHAKGKANSLRRKAANAEAAAAAAQSSGGSSGLNIKHMGYGGGATFFAHTPQSATSSIPNVSHGHTRSSGSMSDGDRPKHESSDSENGLYPRFFGSGGPQFTGDSSTLSLEERLLQDEEDDINFHTEAGKSKALEILGRTEVGRKQAEKIFGPDVWSPSRGPLSEHSQRMTPTDMDEGLKQNDIKVDQMFMEMTNQDDEDDQKKKDILAPNGAVTAELFENERNGLDAMLDGE